MRDSVTLPFVMYGARSAAAGGMPYIRKQVEAIEQAVNENPGLAFDLARTIIESVCKTVLTERAIAFDKTQDLPGLFKVVTRSLPFLPPSATAEAELRKSLARTLSGLHTTVIGICELRNRLGFASHGVGAPRAELEPIQAVLAAAAADAIVGFVHRVHVQDRELSPSPSLEYGANPKFNDHVDELHAAIRVFEAEFKPSEVLFQMEPESYRVYLSEFEPRDAVDETNEGPSEVPGVAP